VIEGKLEPAPSSESDAEQPILLTDEHLEATVRDFEDGISIFPVFTLAMSVVLTLFFIRELATGALEDEASIIAAGALTRDGVLAGEYWRMVSASFLHGGWGHLIGNLIAFYILGMALEHAIGPHRTLFVYFITAITGSVLSITLQPGPSVGASGAVFGLLGAIMAVLYRNRAEIGMRDRRIYVVLGAWALYQILIGAMDPMIDNGAHVGGMFGGLAMGWYSRLRVSGQSLG
jgi:rhomboid protease GluP